MTQITKKYKSKKKTSINKRRKSKTRKQKRKRQFTKRNKNKGTGNNKKNRMLRGGTGSESKSDSDPDYHIVLDDNNQIIIGKTVPKVIVGRLNDYHVFLTKLDYLFFLLETLHTVNIAKNFSDKKIEELTQKIEENKKILNGIQDQAEKGKLLSKILEDSKWKKKLGDREVENISNIKKLTDKMEETKQIMKEYITKLNLEDKLETEPNLVKHILLDYYIRDFLIYVNTSIAVIGNIVLPEKDTGVREPIMASEDIASLISLLEKHNIYIDRSDERTKRFKNPYTIKENYEIFKKWYIEQVNDHKGQLKEQALMYKEETDQRNAARQKIVDAENEQKERASMFSQEILQKEVEEKQRELKEVDAMNEEERRQRETIVMQENETINYWFSVTSIDNLFGIKQQIKDIISTNSACDEFKKIVKHYNGTKKVYQGAEKDITNQICIVGVVMGYISKLLDDAKKCRLLLKGSACIQVFAETLNSIQDLDYVIMPFDKNHSPVTPEEQREIALQISYLVLWLLLDTDFLLINAFRSGDEVNHFVDVNFLKTNLVLKKIDKSEELFQTLEVNKSSIVKITLAEQAPSGEKYLYYPLVDIGYGYDQFDPTVKQIYETGITRSAGGDINILIFYLNMQSFLEEINYNILTYYVNGTQDQNKFYISKVKDYIPVIVEFLHKEEFDKFYGENPNVKRGDLTNAIYMNFIGKLYIETLNASSMLYMSTNVSDSILHDIILKLIYNDNVQYSQSIRSLLRNSRPPTPVQSAHTSPF